MVQIQERKTTSISPKNPYQPEIIWDCLPEDFVLPDEPVESILQPLLAAALTEALDLAGLITATMLIASNMALVAKIDGKTVVKAPDWFFVPQVSPVGRNIIRRSYTPHREGGLPAVVMEFLSETDTSEYSIRPFLPYGKMWFYEQVIRVPIYIIFDPASALLEVRQLNSEGVYELQSLDENGRYFLDCLGLYLGVWEGRRIEQEAHWLRWWDRDGELLLWGSEKIEREKQRAEQAESENAKLKELLRQRGIDIPEN